MIHLDRDVCDRARLARDPRFDGLFFIGVKSTGIYCRPICPARSPRSENIEYYPSAAAAAAAGLRPCLRCRPETAPGTPAWNGTSASVSRAMHLIRQGALNDGSVDQLSDRLGLSSRHLRRLFRKHIGTTPKIIADHQRLLFAKKLVMETDIPVTQAALASGYGSLRRFNAAFRKGVGRTPSQMRRSRSQAQPVETSGVRCTLDLSYRPPYDWDRMLAFFQRRAIPGVEHVANGTYRRTVRLGSGRGEIAVRHAAKGFGLKLEICLTDDRNLMTVVERVKRMFDLDANPQAIHWTLRQDPLLDCLIRQTPGLRLPGSWDPFETAVRAVIGQQISVKGAVTQMGRLVRQAGMPCDLAEDVHLAHFFPEANDLANMDWTTIGMPKARKTTLRRLADEVASGALPLEAAAGLPAFIDAITQIRGIGDWTANYIAMRALGEPDGFPASDLGILKALQKGPDRPTAKQAAARAENWRPWRAYACIYLWHSLGNTLEEA
ncbi:AlkA N-terminal domain-containing protein [uncultured Desulfosarcina sp.]|uniref:AlkA N-terminal domain-containing protein n=1 Tax=uncultured Desulfosarcina sp. TaxID=218289 RepID=UPI0029C84180|nr:AlkA N-terminal domain-containing protein [uncultured Desulfosarcina sp.]